MRRSFMIGVSNGPIQWESACKIWPLLDGSQKLDECSFACARKIFATAPMLGCSLKFTDINAKVYFMIELYPIDTN